MLALIDAGKLDDAEQAAQAMIERWPDIHDGYDCFGMVHQVRGEKSQAAEYYRKVVALARKDPSLYEHEFPEYYQDLIDRLDPMPTRWGSAPKPPGYLKPNDAKVRIAPRYRRGRR